MQLKKFLFVPDELQALKKVTLSPEQDLRNGRKNEAARWETGACWDSSDLDLSLGVFSIFHFVKYHFITNIFVIFLCFVQTEMQQAIKPSG